jgi:formyltetrahydrofolate hydrolase
VPLTIDFNASQHTILNSGTDFICTSTCTSAQGPIIHQEVAWVSPEKEEEEDIQRGGKIPDLVFFETNSINTSLGQNLCLNKSLGL